MSYTMRCFRFQFELLNEPKLIHNFINNDSDGFSLSYYNLFDEKQFYV